jgi:transaldolase
LLSFAERGQVGEPLPADGGDAEQVLAEFEAAGVSPSELASRLQREGAEAFDASWSELLQSIEEKSRKLAAAG